jgi:hypothetical protein
MADEATKNLACRALELWLNLEIGKCRSTGNYVQVEELLKRRFKTEELNPLLKVLGLLETALIEDALRNREYLSDEERELIIKDVVSQLVDKFPEVVKEMEKLLDDISGKIKEFKRYAQKYGSGGE